MDSLLVSNLWILNRQNSLSQGGNFRDKERETGGNAGGFQRMELIDEYQVGKPPARSDGGDNGNRGPPPRNRKPVSAAASLFYNGHGENPAVGSGPAPTNSGPGSSLANGAGEGQLIPDDRLNFLIQSMAEMKERINQTDYLTQKQAEAVLPSVTTLNRFADLQRENAQLQSEIIHWKTEADAACRETDRANLALDQLRKHITAILTVCALPIDDGTPSVDGPSSPVVATIDLRVAQLAENITRLVQVPELVSQDQRNTDVDRLVDSWLQETRVPDEKMAVENP
ncbi:hypothetical protein BJ085DRAFT_37861 [Dimargaris cristalligena]|uniref:Uncharacterized protein n=1 Tax=Dimargaris cristalligena TaxID=215637 RepID=A0A4P9ZPM8_9FUNG|nr:hypothetical protein BJ085DRAFT_37861 [Dimargaris cristalligena]|eukprot:RKP35205.1 hypothetical protein BJ085DRAFT_37861 [Dimargaris cristalligena]